MNIVVVDGAHLNGDADFPEINLNKYGWQQYPELPPEEMSERCWRSDIIVSVNTPIDKKILDKSFKLQMIAVAGEDISHIDIAHASARGIRISHVPGHSPANQESVATICTEVVANINAFIAQEDRNLIRNAG